MTIWSAEIKVISILSESIKGQFPDLEKELERLIKADDENIVLLYSRRCLEVIVSDLCESELNRPRKTEPLKGIIDKLNREEKVPSNIITSMHHLNSLSTFGAHPKDFDPEQVKPVLNNLTTIIKWYLKYSEAHTFEKTKTEELKSKGTEPGESILDSQRPKKKLTFLISGLGLLVVMIVAAMFIFEIIGGEKQSKELEKSIAVRPFWNESTDQENEFFVNGITEDIRNNLAKIADLRVLSRGSVEKYRDIQYSTTDIGKELEVTYVLEGTAQRIGNQVKIHVQLILAEQEDHIWEDTYRENIEDVTKVFDIQNQIAQSVAIEIKAVISAEEKELIARNMTANLTAYDFYQQGLEAFNKEEYVRAEELYHRALDYDSTFAKAYVELGWVFLEKYYWETYFTEDFLDSVIIMANIALSYDDQVSEAYTLRGVYHEEIGNPELALNEYNKAIEYNPNDWNAYRSIAGLYGEEPIKQIENYLKAISLNHGPQLPVSLRNLGFAYLRVGFFEKAKHHFKEALALDGDSINYLRNWIFVEFSLENFENSLAIERKLLKLDTTFILHPLIFNLTGQHQEAYLIYINLFESREDSEWVPLIISHRIGIALWNMGKYVEAEEYFDHQVKYCIESIELGRGYETSKAAYYDLAGAYSCLGEKEKALDNLNEFNNKQFIPLWWVIQFTFDPLFENIRDKPEFQRILRDQTSKYKAEHERVRKWLKENDML